MFIPRIIPVLLLKGKGLVKTVKFNKKTASYIGDPINAVKIFNDMEADELVFLDILASLENRSVSVETVKDIGDEAFMPFAVGGGIKTIDQIKELINAGAEKVILNTVSIENPELITQASGLFGNQSIIISIDVKKNSSGKYKVYSHCGSKETKLNPVEYARQVALLGAGEIMINSIDRDGTMEGYDLELVQKIADAVSVPLIACGGAGKLTDFYNAAKTGNASAVAAGSMFVFHGQKRAVLINYPSKEEMKEIFVER
ncbi:MAG: imidazole glycerol phosphate synthase subunit HisF [Flavobacterium sp.]|nr:imidazole glycerol phosphate synthase subunit HisF [Flavobacterium sp.]